ncbi:uncharacterized protein PV07_08734 [Cladophialophora immunda]|uniref:FAD/NAD(P)-binding domain-containing protein n=1 Tax=Cladophialophora immunda TaxID=569365 RepID=A0A0D2C2Z8_9EURO|nr:uncharacterized protein PV07_08734 [Cladophialophora immunda]KIW25568.1 hypothetical protein PV07_08734 [Cladophialophora immunda]
MSTTNLTTSETTGDAGVAYDALVIGTGFGGIQMLHELGKRGSPSAMLAGSSWFAAKVTEPSVLISATLRLPSSRSRETRGVQRPSGWADQLGKLHAVCSALREDEIEALRSAERASRMLLGEDFDRDWTEEELVSSLGAMMEIDTVTEETGVGAGRNKLDLNKARTIEEKDEMKE